jgi:hypothetical protein
MGPWTATVGGCRASGADGIRRGLADVRIGCLLPRAADGGQPGSGADRIDRPLPRWRTV